MRNGVRDLVVSPGSRSQALALVAAELERSGSARLHVRIDERVAGFLALGLARETGAPAVVITTSGTATANLHPAVLEAHEAGIPLIVLTGRPAGGAARHPGQPDHAAGRPVRGGGALVASTSMRPAASADERGARARRSRERRCAPRSARTPPTRAPSTSTSRSASRSRSRSRRCRRSRTGPLPATAGPDGARPRDRLDSTDGPRTVVVAGADAGPRAEEFARAGGFPLLAEVSSGAHFGPNLVVAYRELLRDDDFGGAVERAIVFGHPTLSREVPGAAHARRRRGDRRRADAARRPTTRATGRGSSAACRSAGVDRPARRRRCAAGSGSWVFASRRLAEAAERASGPRCGRARRRQGAVLRAGRRARLRQGRARRRARTDHAAAARRGALAVHLAARPARPRGVPPDPGCRPDRAGQEDPRAREPRPRRHRRHDRHRDRASRSPARRAADDGGDARAV